ncbi:MAG: Hpt domain-containing protein, partial [Acidobacteriota bacterium]
MSKTVDNELLLGFFAEAKSYLPEIMQGVVDFRANPAQVDRLEISYRYAHTIKGASSMIGLETLSRVAAHLEEIFEDIAAGRMTLNESTAAAVGYTVALISTYLDSAAQGNFNERPFLAEALDSLRRLRDFSEGKGLPFIAESPEEETGSADEAPPENPMFEREMEPPAFEEAVALRQESTDESVEAKVETSQVETPSVETAEEHRYDTSPLASNPITDAAEFTEDAPTSVESREETTGALVSSESSRLDSQVMESEPSASSEAPIEVAALIKVDPTSDDVLGISPLEQTHAQAVVENQTAEEWDGIVFENPDWTIESQSYASVEQSSLDVPALENPVYESSTESAA